MNSRVIALAAMMLGASAVSSFAAVDAGSFVSNPSITAGSALANDLEGVTGNAARAAELDALIIAISKLNAPKADKQAAIAAALSAYGTLAGGASASAAAQAAAAAVDNGTAAIGGQQGTQSAN